MASRQEVFITDWWMSPRLYLKRPVDVQDPNDDVYRLDHVLRHALARGVKLYVLLFNEPRTALYQDSQATLRHFQSFLAPYGHLVSILRHPNNLLPTMVWSHHEKTVIVDQSIAFLGGLDLCIGRWDDSSHCITQRKEGSRVFFPGKEYHNTYLKDF